MEDEIEPTIVESLEPKLVVWSSIWPHTPDQLIRFDLQPEGTGTSLTWTLTSPIEMDSSAVGHRRYRLNQLIWAELRYSYGS